MAHDGKRQQRAIALQTVHEATQELTYFCAASLPHSMTPAPRFIVIIAPCLIEPCSSIPHESGVTITDGVEKERGRGGSVDSSPASDSLGG